jgi:hypothetical protein
MASFYNDYKFGKSMEKKLIEKIDQYFNDSVKEEENEFSKHDFKGQTYTYELKSRNCKYNTFPTTLIPFDKVIPNKPNQIFLFNFEDGLYYIEYNEELFKTFSLKTFVRKQRVDYYDKPKLYYYIPIEKLKQIPV